MKVYLLLLYSTLCLSASQPNIVLLIADDLGYGEVETFPANSPHGRISTPNINAFAKEGLQFSDAYAGEAVCAPSRASLLTGLHTGHCPIRGNAGISLSPSYVTIPKLLKEAGYNTGAIGKWGLGGNDTDGFPHNHGFDYYYGQLGQGECHNYYPHYVWLNREHEPHPENVNASQERCMSDPSSCSFTQDLFTNKALEWLNNQTQDKPFFLYLAWTIPHAGGYQGTLETGAPAPSWHPYGNESWPDVEKGHASEITSYEDRDVGRVMSALKKLGFDSNTIVFFVSDNGAHNEGGHNYLFFDSSGPLRGFKRSLYEGGIRSPSLARWPGKITPGHSNYSWAFWDLMPTLSEIAGIPASKLPENDGVSIVPTLLGKTQPPKDYLYWEFCTNKKWGHAIRKDNWKAVTLSLTEPFELYDLSVDIGETNNVAKEHPKIVATLTELANKAHVDNAHFPKVQPCVSS